MRIPDPQRRPDLYRSQETIPIKHPNGYEGPGLDQKESHLREGYDPQSQNPETQFTPGDSKEGVIGGARLMPTLPAGVMPPPSGEPVGPNMLPTQPSVPYPTQNTYAPPVEPAPAPIYSPPSMGIPQDAPLNGSQLQSPGPSPMNSAPMKSPPMDSPPMDSQPPMSGRSNPSFDRRADLGRSAKPPAARSFNQDVPYRSDRSVGSVTMGPQFAPVNKPLTEARSSTDTTWKMSNPSAGRVRSWNWRAGRAQAAKSAPVDPVRRAVEVDPETDPDRPGRVLLQ